MDDTDAMTTGEVILYRLAGGPATLRELADVCSRGEATVRAAVAYLGDLVRYAFGRWHLAPLRGVRHELVSCHRRGRFMPPDDCYDLFVAAASLPGEPAQRTNPCTGCRVGACVRLGYAGAHVSHVTAGAVLRAAFGGQYGIGGHLARAEALLDEQLGEATP